MNKFWKLAKQPRIQLVAKFGLIYLIFLALCWHRLDPDFGWHLKSGQYYRSHWIPQHDLYTYTSRGFAWINHEWGNDLLLSLIYSAGGYALASVVYAGLWTAGFAVRALRSKLIFLLTATAATLPYAGIRPVAWTFLFFALLLNLLEAKRPDWRKIGLLFLVWANLHAGFLIGLVIILYYLVRRRDLYFARLLWISTAATFINPYGPRLYQEIGRTIFDSQLHNQIAEWNYFVIYAPTLAFVSLWWAGFVLFRRRPLKNWLGLGQVMFVAAMSASRNVPLFVISTVGDLDGFYAKFRAEAPKKINRAAKLILVAGGTAILAYVVYAAYPTFIPWTSRDSTYPVQAAAYLRARPCPGNLFSDYDYGGYLIWQLPSEPVYIDGRMSSWRDRDGEKYLNTYLKILTDTKTRNAEFARYGVECVLMRDLHYDFIKDLQTDGWQTIIKANRGTLLEKT